MNLKLLVIAIFCLEMATAQKSGEQISIAFQNAPIQEVLNQLGQKTGYTFYYANEWLGARSITQEFQNATLKQILAQVFKETDLNFFISVDHRVILTRNNSIYDRLPQGFFLSREKSLTEEANFAGLQSQPIVLEKQGTNKDQVVETIRIGKENRDGGQRRFTLSGIVTNTLTGKPIPNLAVLVRANGLGTATNEEGYYELVLPAGLNILETSSLGIAESKRNVIIYNNGKLNIRLEETFELLDEVVVNATATKNVEDASTGSTTIGSEESKNIPLVLGERDVLKVATTLPGVTTAGEGASGFNVRGGKTDQNLILLDKAVIYNPSHFFGIFQALNPFAIEDVTIYKGHIPAEYGGRLSSVFDINTKKANTQNFSGEASLGPVTANVVLEVPIVKEKSGLLIGGRVAYSDWVLQSLKDVSLQKSSANFYDVMAKYDHRINDKNGLRVSGYYSKDAFSITSDSLYGYSNRLFSLQWDHKFDERNSGSLLLANSEYQFDIGYDGSEIDNFSQKYHIGETEVKARFRYLMNEKHNIDYGISAKVYNVSPGELLPNSPQDIILPLTIQKERALESAVFVTDNFKVTDKLLLDLGLRYSFYAAMGPSDPRNYQEGLPVSNGSVLDTLHYDKNKFIKTYGGPEIRISARYLLSENSSIKASFDNANQYIHTLSNTTTVSPIDTWKLSDYNIKPQRANQFVLGFYKNLNGTDYEFSLEGFYKMQKNLLDFKTGAKLLLNQYVETEVLQGEGRAYGIEFLLRKNTGNLNGWIGYTYSRSLLKLESEFREERVNDGRYFPSNFDKPHDFSLVLNYKFTKRYSFSANFIYQTGRPVTFPVGNYSFNGIEYVLYSDRNQYRIPDYYRLDIGFNIEGNHKIKKIAHSFWNISVYNVLGRNNPYSVFFVSNNGEIRALQSSIFSVPVPSITYNFKF
jgi:hypothetical protein